MDITASDTHLLEILVEFLCHSFGKGCDQYAFIQFCTSADFFKKVIHLILGRADFYRRIEQTCRSNYLLNHKSFRLLEFIIGRCGADEDFLSGNLLKFLKLERSVI